MGISFAYSRLENPILTKDTENRLLHPLIKSRIDQVEEGVSLAELSGAGLLAKVAIGAVVSGALETGAEVERANIIASAAVGAGFFRIGKFHGSRLVGLQQHLNKRIGAPLLAEPFLIPHKENHETNK